ncbi:MAG: hypothetical protein ACYC27_13065 [Armatimonadota bacterium]
MNKFYKLLVCLSLIIISTSTGYALSIFIPPLPDYITKTPVIAEGHIRIAEGKTVLLVDRFLKGTASNVITVTYDSRWFPALKVDNGERVILFLSKLNPEGTEAHMYAGNCGKWPMDLKVPYGQKTYRTNDLDRFSAVIDAINNALAGNDFEDRARKIIAMIQSDDEMIQLAGLQLVSSSAFRDTLGKGNNLLRIRQIAAFALPRLKSDNPDIKIEAAVVTESAPISVAAPALIPLLTDPGRNVAYRAAGELGSVFTNLKLPRPVVVPSKLQFGDKVDSVDINQFRQNARNWSEAVWAKKADAQIAKDLERLHKSLESDSELEKESAKIYLNILEGSQTGTK